MIPIRWPNFNLWERRIIQFLILIIIISSILVFWSRDKKQTGPIGGGKYIEGIIADNKTAATFENLKRLTNCGLLRFDENHNLKNDLIDKYEVSDDKLTYAFYLKSQFKAEAIKEIIAKQDGFWRDLEIKAEGENILKIILKQPFGPLLAYLTEPIFPHGPYKIQNEDENKIVLEKREDFHSAKPFIETIEFRLYQNQNNLMKDLNSGKIMGGGFLDQEEIKIQNKNLKKYPMELPRYYTLFFNLDRETAKDKKIRKKLSLNETLDNEVSFTLVTSDLPLQRKLAEDIAKRWENLKVKIHIEYYDPVKLQNDIIPKRNYDLLLFGLDYGADADPYPFWHSTQAAGGIGSNLSNFRNNEADRILEEARKTFSETERAEKYQEFLRIWNDEAPAIQIKQSNYDYYVSDKVKGVTIRDGIDIADRFAFIDQWYIKGR